MSNLSVWLLQTLYVYMDVNVAVLLGSVAGAAAEALEKAAGAQTRPAHSPTGTALRWRGRGGGRQGSPEGRT